MGEEINGAFGKRQSHYVTVLLPQKVLEKYLIQASSSKGHS